MAAVDIDVADAVVTDLNLDPLTNFGRDFIAERSYPDWDLQLKGEPPKFRVDVVPAGYQSSQLANNSGQIRHVVEVQIVMRQTGISADAEGKRDKDTLDDLKLVLENMADFFVAYDLTTLGTVRWLPTRQDKPIEASLDRKHLREWGQYTGIIRLSYEVVS